MYIVQQRCVYIKKTGVQRGLRVPLTRCMRHIPAQWLAVVRRTSLVLVAFACPESEVAPAPTASH